MYITQALNLTHVEDFGRQQGKLVLDYNADTKISENTECGAGVRREVHYTFPKRISRFVFIRSGKISAVFASEKSVYDGIKQQVLPETAQTYILSANLLRQLQ
ncbi:hypothetical protein [Rahnella bruchi]|uniref:hypothetical protein n=1 Tax=Rahnella bruchi TaxID=1510573 RepID=UPI000EA0D129|nr:hypothetical protein [Rahnella bruchi]